MQDLQPAVQEALQDAGKFLFPAREIEEHAAALGGRPLQPRRAQGLERSLRAAGGAHPPPAPPAFGSPYFGPAAPGAWRAPPAPPAARTRTRRFLPMEALTSARLPQATRFPSRNMATWVQ